MIPLSTPELTEQNATTSSPPSPSTLAIDSPPKPSSIKTYYPSPRDILHVSAILSATKIPAELIDIILSLAEYWASITARLDLGAASSGTESNEAGSPPTIRAIGRQKEHVLLLQTKPLCSGAADEGCFVDADSREVKTSDRAERDQDSTTKHYATLPLDQIPESRTKFPARRVTWRIRSRDQGWGGEGGDTYEKSWTGFRGSVLRFRPTERQDEDGWQRDSETYLKTWAAGLEKATETEAEADGFYEEGDDEEERVWKRGGWEFGDMKIQVNARADSEVREHVVVWDHRDDIEADDDRATETLIQAGRGKGTGAGKQVRALQRGDIVELHSYAFFPGWQNIVEAAEIRVEFAL